MRLLFRYIQTLEGHAPHLQLLLLREALHGDYSFEELGTVECVAYRVLGRMLWAPAISLRMVTSKRAVTCFPRLAGMQLARVWGGGF
jgi:hypothetical protein